MLIAIDRVVYKQAFEYTKHKDYYICMASMMFASTKSQLRRTIEQMGLDINDYVILSA